MYRSRFVRGRQQLADTLTNSGEFLAQERIDDSHGALAILASNSKPSRTDMMAMPCTAIGPLIMIFCR